MNKLTLVYWIPFLVAPIQLLIGECRPEEAFEENEWSNVAGNGDDMALPVTGGRNGSGLQELSYSDGERMSHQEMPSDCCAEESKCCFSDSSFFSSIDPVLKLRIAAFLPTPERFHEIYGDSMPSYQIEADRNEKKFAIGLLVKSGLIYQVTDRIFLDLFIDYISTSPRRLKPTPISAV